MKKERNTWNLSFLAFLSKSGCQKYTTWVHGYPTPNCFCNVMSLFLKKNNLKKIIFEDNVMSLFYRFVKHYTNLIYVKEKSFCLAFPHFTQ